MEKLKLVEATQLKTGLPDFHPGDTINACSNFRASSSPATALE